MMKVTISICPGGDESRERVIETLLVANVSALADVSDYVYTFSDDKRDLALWPEGTVEGHPRAEGAWALLRRILLQAELTPWGPGDH